MADLKDLLSKGLSAASQGGSSLNSMTGGVVAGRGVRMKKSQTLLGAIAGVFIGILLVLGSPVALWYAESQHTAEDFASATPVDTSSGTDGYVSFTGTPEVASPLACVEGQKSCLYYLEENQELKTITEEQCGDVSDDARIIAPTVLECDEDGNCEQCYTVERDEWQTQTQDEQYGSATVGAYTVNFSSDALMLGLEENIIEQSATTRDVWTTFPVPTALTVAGDSIGSVISSAEKTYVLSPYDASLTLTKLQERDSTMGWALRAVTFAMLFIGFASIFGPISYFSHVLRKIPIIGSFIKEATGLIVGLVSFLLAIVTFAVLWVLVSIIQNVFVLIAVLALLGAGFAVYMKVKKEPAPKA